MLKLCNKPIGRFIDNLKHLSPNVCTHHIFMEEMLSQFANQIVC